MYGSTFDDYRKKLIIKKEEMHKNKPPPPLLFKLKTLQKKRGDLYSFNHNTMKRRLNRLQ